LDETTVRAILPWTALRSTLINGDAAKGEPNESIKSYPMRMVRVRPAKTRCRDDEDDE
jgi:hypothetical protein